jgi:hypothetical protein
MRGWHAGLALAVTVAACGGGAEQAPPAQGPSSPTVPSASTSAGTATPTGTPTATSAPTGTSTSTNAAPVEMKSPVPTAMAADLQSIGLDAKSLPPMEKLEPKQLRSVMKLLSRSLGIGCNDCHQYGDFALTTRRKKIAAKMWDEFVVKLTMADGSSMFCDSCHQGRVTQLDRTDKKALSKWMDASFVQGVKRKDASEQSCESCHVGWDMTFLTSWGK